MIRRWLGLALLALMSPALAGNANTRLVLPKGARIGVVTVLDPAITHYHVAKDLEDSFLKTQLVRWNVDAMLAGSLKDRFAELGLVEVPLAPTDALTRDRDTCFVNAALVKGLPRDCTQPFADLAISEHLDAIIVLAPGRNDSAHGRRRKELPDYLSGWGYYTHAGAGSRPELFNMTELLLVGMTPKGMKLAAREWGGSYEQQWSSYAGQPEQKAVSPEELGELVPLFEDVLNRQCSRLLDQVDIR